MTDPRSMQHAFNAAQAIEKARQKNGGLLSILETSIIIEHAINADTKDLRSLLYEAIVELEYVQCAEDHVQCASAKGAAIVEAGMKLLGVQDLSAEKLGDLK